MFECVLLLNSVVTSSMKLHALDQKTASTCTPDLHTMRIPQSQALVQLFIALQAVKSWMRAWDRGYNM